MDRQPVHRAPVAVGEVQVRLPPGGVGGRAPCAPGDHLVDGLLQPFEATFRAGWAHARKRTSRGTPRVGRRCRERGRHPMQCKPPVRHVTLLSEGIHTKRYTLFRPSNCRKIRDHLNSLTRRGSLRQNGSILQAEQRTTDWSRPIVDHHTLSFTALSSYSFPSNACATTRPTALMQDASGARIAVQPLRRVPPTTPITQEYGEHMRTIEYRAHIT